MHFSLSKCDHHHKESNPHAHVQEQNTIATEPPHEKLTWKGSCAKSLNIHSLEMQSVIVYTSSMCSICGGPTQC